MFYQKDDKVYLDYPKWIEYRDDFYKNYPKPEDIYRIDIELTNSALFLADVHCFRNAHGAFSGYNGLGEYVYSMGCGLPASTCDYAWDDWSTVGQVFEYMHPSGRPAYRMIVESNHSDPTYGERIILFSNFQTIWTETWGYNKPNLFAFYKNRFWLVSFYQYASDFSLKDRGLPLVVDTMHYKIQPSHVLEEHDEHKEFLPEILGNPNDFSAWCLYADYFADQDWYFAKYMQEIIYLGKERSVIEGMERGVNRRSFVSNWYDYSLNLASRKLNARTAKFLLLLLMQFIYKPGSLVRFKWSW